MFARSLLAVALVTLAAAGRAAAQDVDSGPPKGEKLPALKVLALSGAQEGKEVDYVAERKGGPTIYVVVQGDKWDRPTHRFLNELGKAVKEHGEKAEVVAVWLTEDKDKTKEYLPQIAKYYEATALTMYPGEKAGPQGWGINGDAHVTVVVAGKGTVAARFGYQSINETAVREVMQALRKATGGKGD
jgi:cytochrome oxidase Cu insertion factor (SCO1/SenC/PrrC family)